MKRVMHIALLALLAMMLMTPISEAYYYSGGSSSLRLYYRSYSTYNWTSPLYRYSTPSGTTGVDYRWRDWVSFQPTQPTQPQPPTPPTQPEPPTTPPDPGTGTQITPSAEEMHMLSLINAERAKAGVAPLEMDPALVRLARMKSQDMIDNNYFSHTSPTYGSPFEMMRNAGITYRTAGENLAGNSSVERAHEALMNSDGHRRNILNPGYKKIGIGIVSGGRYGKMITQLFVG